ncbi:hypothetical protein [Microvirga roseola]|uniref:hypothetical protein n=1 Tax=Microvirga roseola TaxID=2883126 RepID=UPI001E3D7F44|nr:hypothetical protein [Microvirga roseola]
MIHRATNQEPGPKRPAEAQPASAFKPVALPALAAAVQAAKPQPTRQPNRELPAILRKEAVLG